MSFATKHYILLSANIHPRDRWVVIRYLRRKLRPSVHVDMLIFDIFGQSGRNKHVVELLRVVVEEICVALQYIDLCGCICILETRDLDVLLEGIDESEFVEVACCNDFGVLVLGENVLSHERVSLSSDDVFFCWRRSFLSCVSCKRKGEKVQGISLLCECGVLCLDLHHAAIRAYAVPKLALACIASSTENKTGIRVSWRTHDAKSNFRRRGTYLYKVGCEQCLCSTICYTSIDRRTGVAV